MLKCLSPVSVKAKSDLSRTLICKSTKKHTIPRLSEIINLCGIVFLLFTCRCGVKSYCCKGREQDLGSFVLCYLTTLALFFT